MKKMCKRCNDTGEIIAVEYMGSYQMMDCPYCEAGARQEQDITLEVDEIDEELFW